MKKDLTMYCICFDQDVPRHTQYNQKNIMCNSVYLKRHEKDSLRRQGFIFDDEGKNISYLNYAFGDLTATYWIWKNAKEEFVGTNHYRRFWDEEEISNIKLNDKTLYISRPVIKFDVSALQQYLDCHGKLGLEFLYKLFDKLDYPLKREVFESLNNVNFFSGCNMFFGHKLVYNKVCELLFSILFPIFDESKEHIGELDEFQRRMVAYLSERILTSLYLNSRYYFGEIDIIDIKYNMVGQ
jgi:hypothetical protein